MMFALLETERRLARPEQRGSCPGCAGDLRATSGEVRIWHWEHVGEDCDPWAEPESDWHLGWKKHVSADRAEVVIEREGQKHRADILCHNGAVLKLQSSAITPVEVRACEDYYKYMAWLFRVTWADRLHYGSKGFWWKGAGGFAQTFATRPVFWDFEDEGRVQEIKLSRVEDHRRGDRVVGKAAKTYTRAQFATFLATGRLA